MKKICKRFLFLIIKAYYFVCVIILICVSTFISGCTWGLMASVDGLSNFSEYHSSMSLNHYLIPEGFLDAYSYIDGDYHYRDNGAGFERVLIYLVYDDETYLQAKNCVFENIELDLENALNCGNCVFYDNLDFSNFREEVYKIIGCGYPRFFTMVGVNDKRNTLLFIGVYVSQPDASILEFAESGFEVYAKKIFSEWYDFDS